MHAYHSFINSNTKERKEEAKPKSVAKGSQGAKRGRQGDTLVGIEIE